EGARSGLKFGDKKLVDGMVKDGLWDVYNDYHMGSAAELCARECNVSRADQDEYAALSYRRALEAQANGWFRDEIVPVEIPARKGTLRVEEDEISRKHSIAASLAYCEWKNRKINILDTPGYGVFVTEAKGAMRVADAAGIVVNGVNGVEVNTERVVRFAQEYDLPIFFVVTKMDRDRASAETILSNLEEKFGKSIVPLQIPVGSEKDFRGVIDLLNQKAYLYQSDGSGSFEEAEIPDELVAKAEEWREQLIEKVAEQNDSLMETFFDAGTLTQDELIRGLREELRDGSIHPVVFAAPSLNIGGHPLLDLIAQIVPSPAEIRLPKVKTSSGEEIELKQNDDHPVALIFKTLSDPFSGQISIVRVYTGKLKSDTSYYNVTKEHEERIGKLQVLQGKQQEHVSHLEPGDIGAVAKLKDSHTGDTISTKDNQVLLSHIQIPEAVISFAIEPRSKGDDDKLSVAIHRIMEEDPAIRFHREEQTHEFLLSGQGQLHVEVTVDKLKNKYGVDVILHPPKVPYRETIKARVEAHGRHKKQSGGHGQFADCKIIMEPIERGQDFEFVDDIFGGSIPRQFIPAVEKGIQETRVNGYLAGYPVVDFRVRLTDGQYHSVDSSEMAFKIAGALAFKDAMSRARPTLLEPIMHIEVYAPTEYIGDIMGDLTSRRGRMEGMDTQGDTQIVRAMVPMSEVLTYGSTLRSITQGRGSFHMEYSHYEEVPKNLQDRIIAETKKGTEEHA
ncbi:MAG: elongation factor G, partial [Acidobacteria bacterium]|nr:elongation factor G [Acidobacteriota bacterium]